MSFRGAIHSITTLFIGVFLGANLTHFHVMHNSMLYDDTNQTNIAMLRPLMLESQPRRDEADQPQQQQQSQEKEGKSPPKATIYHHASSRQLGLCKATLKQVERELHDCRNQRGHHQRATAQTTFTNPLRSGLLNMNATASMAQHPVCRYVLPHPVPNAMAIWSAQLARIHKASQLPNDQKYDLSDFTAELLHLISNRLPRAVKTVPHRWDSVKRVLDVGYKRWKYLHDLSKLRKKVRKAEDANATRKVNILIMGGSLLVGTNCRKTLSGLGIKRLVIPNRHCTWANRLEKFLNHLLGPILGVDTNSKDFDSIWDLVQVTKTAMGGTNTQTGQFILEYDLLPVDARHPDIIINAYSTNDMHIFTALDAAQRNVSLRDKVFDMIQDYVRHVLQRRSPNCDDDDDSEGKRRRQHTVPPLLLHMDDYLGNEQREIWATTELSQSVHVLANYYGFTSMSYANVVRDLVYGDTHESWFSPSGWYNQTATPGSSDSKIMFREIHPGMGMHISATWVTAYTMLHLATTFCSLEWSQTGNSSLAPWHDDTQPFSYDRPLLALPPLEGRVVVVPGKPQRPPRDLLPPLLNKHLSLENITELWRQPSPQLSQDMASWSPSASSTSCDDEQRTVHCPFSWVSSLSQQQKEVSLVQDYFDARMVSNEGWNLVLDHDKLGYVPVGGRNASMTLVFDNVTQPIRTVTFFLMKSYGPRWAKSRVQVTVQQGETALLLSHVLEGFHEKQTSEIYTEPLSLKQTIHPGSTFRLRMELVDGETFKLMGVAVCS